MYTHHNPPLVIPPKILQEMKLGDVKSGMSQRVLLVDPTFYFHAYKYKERVAEFCRLTESAHRYHSSDAVRAATFVYTVPLEELLASDELNRMVERPIFYIFMTDFCASTLFARALGSLKGLFCYNEPHAFVTLSEKKKRIDFGNRSDSKQWQKELNIAVKLMSRTFQPDDIALIKDQPRTNYIMGEMLATNRDSRGIFMYSELSDYLAAVFRQSRRRQYVRARMMHSIRETGILEAVSGIDKSRLSDAKIAALHWLTQMYLFAHFMAQYPGARIRTLRSDLFLNDPVTVLERAARFFGIPTVRDDIDKIVQGEVFNTHSKLAGRVFGKEQQRQQVLRAMEYNRFEIREGMEWAGNIMAVWPIPDILPVPLVKPHEIGAGE